MGAISTGDGSAQAIREAMLNATEEAFSILPKAGKEHRLTLWNPHVEVICTRDRGTKRSCDLKAVK